MGQGRASGKCAEFVAVEFTLMGDVSVEADVIAMFCKAHTDLGPIGGVVINAGIVASAMPLAAMSLERLERVFRVNVLGAYLCAREAARTLARSRGGKGGSMVLVSSAASRLGSPGEYVDYAGSAAERCRRVRHRSHTGRHRRAVIAPSCGSPGTARTSGRGPAL